MSQITNRETVNVFFAADERYTPYLGVALASLSANASKDYNYRVRILTTDVDTETLAKLRECVSDNVTVTLCNITEKIKRVQRELKVRLRDYYSESIYYRLFIPSMFPELSRAVYLDSDIVLLDDVAKLYFTEVGDNLVGAVTDESVTGVPVFCDYVVNYIGVGEAEKYFNSGVLLMNLDGMRAAMIEEKFLHLLVKYNFNTVAPDQDYLNYLCFGRVKYLGMSWNKHAIKCGNIKDSELCLVHFNMFNKPWHYGGVPYEKKFWKYAKLTPYYTALIEEREAYTEEERQNDLRGSEKLLMSAKEIFEGDESMARVASKEDFSACLTLC